MTLVTRIEEFDTWRPGYGLATVQVLIAGTQTLASIFQDEALTIPALNPVTLIEKTDSGISYGKFQVPLYVGVPYQLQINSVDETGVSRPAVTSLDGQDASNAVATVTGGTTPFLLRDSLARRIDPRDYGTMLQVNQPGASAATNTAALVAATGVASAGYGIVEIPPGTYAVNPFTIPAGVILRGAGRLQTVLQSNFAGKVITIGGTRAGLTRLTIDGASLVPNSVGVYAANIDDFVLDDVHIERFETGLFRQGGANCDWRELFIEDCVTGYKAYGDSAAGAGGTLQFNQWRGGFVNTCSSIGIDLRSVDVACQQNSFHGIVFDSNFGSAAVSIIGARSLTFETCRWTRNSGNLLVADPAPLTALNGVIGLEFVGGAMESGTLSFQGTYSAVAFRRMALNAVSVTITPPGQNIVVEDCQVPNPTISGVPTCWLYRQTINQGAAFVLTSDNTAHKAWSIRLTPGQNIYLEGKAVGRQRNGTNTAFFHFEVSAGQPGATLNYKNQTSTFTGGNLVIGATSGATGRIVAATNSGPTGSLTLYDVTGTFVDNENLVDGSGGVAQANGTQSTSASALVGTVLVIRTQRMDSNYNATFAANGPDIELQVTGDSGQTVEWTVDVQTSSDQQTLIALAQFEVPPPPPPSGATLGYHSLVGHWTVGLIVQGQASHATAVITADANSGAIGTLSLSNVTGTFISGEVIGIANLSAVALAN